MKYLAWFLFLLGAVTVFGNVQLAVASARNRARRCDRHISLIPLFDGLFFCLGVSLWYHEDVSAGMGFMIFLGFMVLWQVFYYAAFRIALGIYRKRIAPD